MRNESEGWWHGGSAGEIGTRTTRYILVARSFHAAACSGCKSTLSMQRVEGRLIEATPRKMGSY